MEKKNKKRECRRKRERGMNECTNDEKKVIVLPLLSTLGLLSKSVQRKYWRKKRF
jgi:hypothetical protein